MIHKMTNKIIVYVVLAIMLVVALFPIYWILITSFKVTSEIYTLVPNFWPKHPTFVGYIKLFTKTDFLSWLKNSMIVALLVSLVSILVSSLAAYALTRFRFIGRNLFGVLIFTAYLIPDTLLFIPIYILAAHLGIAQKIGGLLVVYPIIIVPYATWVLTSYFSTLPVEIEEAGMIDGCSRLQVLIRITMPLASPGIIATFIFSFTMCWSEFTYALVILSGTAKTLPLGLSGLILGDIPPWNLIMAGAIISLIPVVLLYTISSRYIVAGLTFGGVK